LIKTYWKDSTSVIPDEMIVCSLFKIIIIPYFITFVYNGHAIGPADNIKEILHIIKEAT
jgi:hypothetical protein